MATATTEPGSPKLPTRRNIALVSGAVAANTAWTRGRLNLETTR